MPADLTLPGTLPGLLRRGSPVVTAKDVRRRGGRTIPVGLPGLVISIGTDPWCFLTGGATGFFEAQDLALDLTDPTGRAHAAWWAWADDRMLRAQLLDPAWSRPDTLHLLAEAHSGRPLANIFIARLRDLCLRLAEVTRG